LVIEDEEVEQIEDKENNNGLELPIKIKGEIPKDTPQYVSKTVLNWSNPKYTEIWSKLPTKLREILATDREWLEEYMYKCVNSRNDKQPCKLFLPSHTKIPPEKSEDGTYDFDVEIINKLFNKLNKSYQDTLLTLYSEKDGIKNYNMLKESLVSLLEKEVPNYSHGYF
jgi:hypothetical protein